MSKSVALVRQQLGAELYAACARNEVGVVEALALQGPTGPAWATIMIAAAYERATDVATFAMARAYKPLATHEAVRRVYYTEDFDHVFHFLLESGYVNVDYDLDRHGTLLGIVTSSRISKRHSLARYLLQHGANPNTTVEMHGYHSILACAAGLSDSEMTGLLVEYGARIGGSGALVFAAQRGKMDTVKLLIAKGADINEMGMVTHDRRSRLRLGAPIHKALEHGHVEVAKVLVEAGADLILEDAQGRKAVDIAIEKGLNAIMLAKLSPVD